MTTTSTSDTTTWTTMRVRDRRLAAAGCWSTITAPPCPTGPDDFSAPGGSSCLRGIQPEPTPGALAERLAQRIAAGEPQQHWQLRGKRPLDVAGGVQPIGHAATREPVVPGRPEYAGGVVDPLGAAHPRRRGRRLDRAGGVAGGGKADHDRALAGPVVV